MAMPIGKLIQSSEFILAHTGRAILLGRGETRGEPARRGACPRGPLAAARRGA